MRPVGLRIEIASLCAAALLCGLLVFVCSDTSGAVAASAGALEGKLASAREEASSISAGLRESHERLAVAEGEAAKAEAHEEKLNALLAEGEERAAQLSAKLRQTRHRLAIEKARLRRSRHVLAERLVAIYESGTPSTASFILGSGDYQQMVTQAGYLREISESDSALADRVGEVQAAVHREVGVVSKLKTKADAYDERLATARERIGAVREAAAAAASRLAAISAEREAALGSLKTDIGKWVKQVQAARAAEARAASAAEAEEEVGRWLGGPYAIPTYIVMCESGGDYGAVNPSSGAGGAYQILPSTWEGYGGKGLPEDASKAEQDRIAGEIWADSGPSAWVCG